MTMSGTYLEFASYRRLHSSFESSVNSSYSTPSLSFALGAALVLVMTALAMFCFSCWYHWRKMSRRSRSSQLPGDGSTASLAIFVNASAALPYELPAEVSIKASYDGEKPTKITSLIPVVMPGDDTPTFVARAFPHAVDVSENTMHLQTDGKQDETPKTASSQ